MAKPKYHWAISVSDPSKHRHAWKAYAGGHFVQACGRKHASVLGDRAAQFVAKVKRNPDWFCVTCATKARLALAAKSAPKPTSRCATSGCGSYAINPSQCGRDDTSDLDLCDVCYWRKRAESVVWPKPRPISEAPKDGSMVLIRLPDQDPQWTIGVFDPRKRWVDLCLATTVVEPTHFLPLPPEVR